MIDDRMLVALQALDAVRSTLEAQSERIAELEAAIRWALGEEGDFGEEPLPLNGKYRRRYWWRTELRKRAALSGGGKNDAT